jgi:hypothetical protein
MRKLFLILLTSITIFITTNGLIYAQELDFPYSIRETSEGFFIELPLTAFREILIRSNTSKEQLDLCMEEYDMLVDTTVSVEDYNTLRQVALDLEGDVVVYKKQRNVALISGGLITAIFAGYIIAGML